MKRWFEMYCEGLYAASLAFAVLFTALAVIGLIVGVLA